MKRKMTYSFKVVLELFDTIAAADLGRIDLHLVHGGDDSDRCPATNPGHAGQEHRPPRTCQHPLHTRHELQHLTEHQYVQVTILTAYNGQ